MFIKYTLAASTILCFMKLVSYLIDGHEQLGIFHEGLLFTMDNLHPELPNSMNMFLQYWDEYLPMASGGEIMLREGKISLDKGINPATVELISPVPLPSSCR